jgi:serine/threonine protein kinase
MDLLEGENLEARRVRKGGKIEPLEVLSLMDDVLDILQAAHDKGVVHRDIKPENLFVTIENQVRLLDFGVARIDVPSDPSKTLAGISMGTPAFMPPEQASAHWNEVDERSDLWAMGASMFVLLTGTYVYRGGTVNESLVQAITGTAPKIATLEPRLPPQVAEIVDKALMRDKMHRYATATEMQIAVRRAFRELQDGADDNRYSLSHGRVAAHSSPPGLILDVDDLDEQHTPDPMAAEMALRPQRGLAFWASIGGALLFLTLIIWAVATDDEETAPSLATDAVRTTTAPEEELPVSVPEGEAPEKPPEPELSSGIPVDALPKESDSAKSGSSSSQKRGGQVVRTPRTPRAPPPKPSAAPPPEEDFDPFAKRH